MKFDFLIFSQLSHGWEVLTSRALSKCIPDCIYGVATWKFTNRPSFMGARMCLTSALGAFQYKPAGLAAFDQQLAGVQVAFWIAIETY
jgi:hypothetical protein